MLLPFDLERPKSSWYGNTRIGEATPHPKGHTDDPRQMLIFLIL